ncbi:hypothetical protein FJZ48_03945 [Candidatus Uhrbacteria bacterium]|nr:hypothetical protein [Candidatus Uhrbacteria bacterium]
MRFESKLIKFLRDISKPPGRIEKHKLDLINALSVLVKNTLVERGQFSTYEEAEDGYKLCQYNTGDPRGSGAEIRKWPQRKINHLSALPGYLSLFEFTGLLNKIRLAPTIILLDVAFRESEQFMKEHFDMTPSEIILRIRPAFVTRREQDEPGRVIRPDFTKKK